MHELESDVRHKLKPGHGASYSELTSDDGA